MRDLTGRLISTGLIGLALPVFFFCRTAPEFGQASTTLLPVNPAVTPPAMDTLAYVMGQFDPARHEWFVPVEKKYASREGMFLRKETWEAFVKMAKAAEGDGVELKILSATRNFISQKSIWEDKWTGKRLVEDGQNLALTTPDPVKRALKILQYSSMPGSSRHHWGTDMDLNALDNSFFAKGEGKKIYDWLTTHAGRYGFCQPYTAGRPVGYHEEKWHWSYMPVARPLTGFCERRLKNEMISGFLGAESAKQVDILQHYILGINQECR